MFYPFGGTKTKQPGYNKIAINFSHYSFISAEKSGKANFVAINLRAEGEHKIFKNISTIDL